MNIQVAWYSLDDRTREAWRADRCLYAYLVPPRDEIVYVGKCWSTCVGDRWKRGAKEAFWDDLENQRRIFEHAVIIGFLTPPDGGRVTRQLLADVESLLISNLLPWGNIQSRSSRIARPGMVVRCDGDWPPKRRLFRDVQ